MSGFVDDYLPALMAQASHLISGEFHRVVLQRGLSVNEWRVLATLASAPPGQAFNTGELARVALMKQPTLSRLLERLAAAGHVEREDQPGNRRCTLARITPGGRRLVQKLMQQASEHEREVLKPFGLQRAEELKHMLKRMIELHQPRA
jgi:DNA-binding MarR family transcriptional regulator